MPRTLRVCPIGIPQHIIQRGNNRQICFANEEDFATYAQWLNEASLRYAVDIHAWVFMTNHVHLLATPQEENGISAMMQYLEDVMCDILMLITSAQVHYGKVDSNPVLLIQMHTCFTANATLNLTPFVHEWWHDPMITAGVATMLMQEVSTLNYGHLILNIWHWVQNTFGLKWNDSPVSASVVPSQDLKQRKPPPKKKTT